MARCEGGGTFLGTIFEKSVFTERGITMQKIAMSREITEIIFSPEKIEEMLNESLSEIIESAFAELLTGAGVENRVFIAAEN